MEDVTPRPFNARTRVHEYGGGDFAVHDGTVYFSNFADQRIYRRPPGGEPQPLTPETGRRFADMVVDRARNRLIAVREDHAGGREPVNEIVGVDLEDGDETVLVTGNDFYSSPRLSPDGGRLAWLTWNHPNMPWDGTELVVCDVNDARTSRERRAGRGRAGRIHLPTGVVPGRHAPLRLGPYGLVEPVPLARGKRRAALREGGGVRLSAVGLRDVHLRLPLARTHRLLLHRTRCLAPRPPGHGERRARAHRDAVLEHRLRARRRGDGRRGLPGWLADGARVHREAGPFHRRDEVLAPVGRE